MSRLIFTFAMLSLCCACFAQTLTVDANGSGDFLSIQEAINHAVDGDIVQVFAGRYEECIDFRGSAIEVRCSNPDDPFAVSSTIVAGNNYTPVVCFYSGEGAQAILNGLTIMSGGGLYGGGICFWGQCSPTVKNCNIINNRATDTGGGIYIRQANPAIKNCLIAGNLSPKGSAIACVQGSVKIENCTIVENISTISTGAVYIYDCANSSIVANNIISHNIGGGFYYFYALPISGYNNLYANVPANYSGWATPQAGDIAVEPYFVSNGWWQDINATPANYSDDIWHTGQYQLRSEWGTWEPQTQQWIKYAQTSGCIDAGGADYDYSREPKPNGSRINIGCCGNTPTASKSQPQILQINITAGPNGSVEPNGTIEIPEGNSITCTAFAANGYVVDKWFIDGNETAAGQEILYVPEIFEPVNISVQFRLILCTAGIAGDLSGDCKVDIADLGIAGNHLYETAPLQPWQKLANTWKYTDDTAHEYVNCFAMDTQSNFYLAGERLTPGADSDYFLLKFNGSGQFGWMKTYNGTGNYIDYVGAMCLDGDGNIYITGTSHVSQIVGNTDCVTIKYSPAGVFQWLASFNGPGNQSDGGTAIAVSTSGKIFVAGYCTGPTGRRDLMTICYSSSGTQLNVDYYDNAQANAIARDLSGNIYVAGEAGTYPQRDFCTLKYNGSGVRQWAAIYNGTGLYYDSAADVAVNSSGNVFVAGTATGYGTHYDYAVVKYTPDGNELWASGYNGTGNFNDTPADMLSDTAGNIYMTGRSMGRLGVEECVTVKLNSAGQQQWVKNYSAGSQFACTGLAIAADSAGNIYVAGAAENITSTGNDKDFILKYNAAGQLLWETGYIGDGTFTNDAGAIYVDSHTNVFTGGVLSGGFTADAAVLKFEPAMKCSTPPTGDFNGDCIVNITDLRTIVEHWLECNLDPQELCYE